MTSNRPIIFRALNDPGSPIFPFDDKVDDDYAGDKD